MKRLLCSVLFGAALLAGVGCHSDAGKSAGGCTCSHSGASACSCAHCKGKAETCTCPK